MSYVKCNTSDSVEAKILQNVHYGVWNPGNFKDCSNSMVDEGQNRPLSKKTHKGDMQLIISDQYPAYPSCGN